jgi:lycopene beta-cyclase
MTFEIRSVGDETFDFTFIGLGASNSLILLSLLKNELLKDKQVLIIEPSKKAENDKTYCFWADSNDSIVHDLAPIISHSFEKLKVSSSQLQDISTQPYFYIRSIDLYKFTLKTLFDENIIILRDEVVAIEFEADEYRISTSGSRYRSRYVFDSRPPVFSEMSEEEIHLKQTFIGLHIKCEKPVLDHTSFEMMNFNVEQNGFTQFMYVIPFNQQEALVELTRFGSEELNQEEVNIVLRNYVSKEWGTYEIIAEEKGCIPMTTFQNEPSNYPGILNTGTAANLIKPSTGYGFKNMYSFALEVTDRISKKDYGNFNKVNIHRKKRFRFYDTLLLIILLRWPDKGKTIFTRLFEKHTATDIFKFLDEKTTYYEELKIFIMLPFGPFLRAVYHYFKHKKQLRYMASLMFMLSYSILAQFSADAALNFGYVILAIGLLVIGIPHGALDHLLIKDNKFSLSGFLLKYCITIALFYLIWLLFPTFSLILFIVFSSLHFGESELISFRTKTHNPVSIVRSFFLGLSILLCIIGTHVEESLTIISHLNANYTFNSLNVKWVFLILSTSSFLYILTESFFSKSASNYGLIFLLLLGIQAPLIISFGLYFIIQHSNNAWKHLQKGLKMSSSELYKQAAWYTLGALIILLLILFNAVQLNSMNDLWAQFFIFIACISLPHFLIMHIFYREKEAV